MYESADQPNQSTCLIPYGNELLPPLHDTCTVLVELAIRLQRTFRAQCDYRMNSFRNDWCRNEILEGIITTNTEQMQRLRAETGGCT